MPRWILRTRAALLTGLTWAVAWAPLGVLAALLIDPANTHDEPWLLIFAIPGFVGGVLFSAVLAAQAQGRSLLELSPRRAALWGAAAGLVTGAVPFFIGAAAGAIPVAVLAPVVMTSIGALSALSAAGSLRLAQRAERQTLARLTQQLLTSDDRGLS